MKRTAILKVVSLTLCLTLWGCGGQSKKDGQNDVGTATESSVIDHDDTFETADSFDLVHDYQYQFGYNYNNVARSEEGYYFLNEGRLMFFDNNTLKADLVCSVPECEHSLTENDQDTCNAYIGARSGIYYNSGSIYYGRYDHSDEKEKKYQIVRLSADGSRKILSEIPVKGVSNSNTFVRLIPHRGYLYFSVSYAADDKKYLYKTPESTAVYRLELNNDNAKPEIWLDSSDFEETGIPVVSKLSACGNKLLLMKESGVLINYPKEQDKRRFPLLCVDIDTKKLTDLGEQYELPEEAADLREFSFLDDRLIFRLWSEDDIKNDLYTMSFDGSDMRKLFTLPYDDCCIVSDAQYVYIIGPTFNRAGSIYDYNDTVMNVSIYDHSMKLINTAEVSVGDNYKHVVQQESVDTDLTIELVGSERAAFVCEDDKLLICGCTIEYYCLPQLNSIPTKYYPYVKYIEKKELLKTGSIAECKDIFVSEKLIPFDS